MSPKIGRMKETDFCPVCRYYLYLKQEEKQEEKKADEPAEKVLIRICRNCGYQEEHTDGGLILEIDLKEKTSEGYKILMNQFTEMDPTLPHVNTIKCPNDICPSNPPSNQEKDVIYLKYDAVNMKFLYICNVCKTRWRSKAD
jgi:DNA-directed RNA polymerase subunit M/transcription elongation factor TFIIS